MIHTIASLSAVYLDLEFISSPAKLCKALADNRLHDGKAHFQYAICSKALLCDCICLCTLAPIHQVSKKRLRVEHTETCFADLLFSHCDMRPRCIPISLGLGALLIGPSRGGFLLTCLQRTIPVPFEWELWIWCHAWNIVHPSAHYLIVHQAEPWSEANADGYNMMTVIKLLPLSFTDEWMDNSFVFTILFWNGGTHVQAPWGRETRRWKVKDDWRHYH